jgi:solute carrier family 12 sodium/potassium/chloride transporter 2
MNARVYGTILLFFLALIVVVGTSLVNKAALSFIAAVAIAILSALIGLLSSNRPGLIEGVTGFPGNFAENFPPAYDKPDTNGQVASNVDFFVLFGIFFPSVTGIMTGASRSGYLRDPSQSIPKGTLISHAITTTLYLIFILLFGTVAVGPLLREKIPMEGLFVASIAWPIKWVTLVGIIFSSAGAAMQCLVRYIS